MFPFICLLLLASLNPYNAQGITSGVYALDEHMQSPTEYGFQRELMAGSTRDFNQLKIRQVGLNPGKSIQLTSNAGTESLIIVQKGPLMVTVNGNEVTVGAGSVGYVPLSSTLLVRNSSQEVATYYLIELTKPSSEGHILSGDTAFILDWDRIEFHSHDKGGIRRFFDQHTTLCSRFEMHATTLNPGLQSHDPHTHRAAELIIMIQGQTEMFIDGTNYAGEDGSIYFLASEISHAIRNTGGEPCQYFAFQFQ